LNGLQLYLTRSDKCDESSLGVLRTAHHINQDEVVGQDSLQRFRVGSDECGKKFAICAQWVHACSELPVVVPTFLAGWVLLGPFGVMGLDHLDRVFLRYFRLRPLVDAKLRGRNLLLTERAECRGRFHLNGDGMRKLPAR